MSTEHLVSIIMPLHNSEKFVAEAIESVLAQTYHHWELIVVDDRSSDSSPSIVESYACKDSRIRFIHLDINVGPAKARNRAIKEAKGKYIAFLDSDDVWMPVKLEEQISFLKKHDLVLTYSAYETMDENSVYINTRYSLPSISYEDMLKSNQIGNLTGIYDVDYFGKVYLDDIGHEDYALLLKLLKKIHHTKGLTQILARYRVVSGSRSAKKFNALKWQWNIYRNIEKLTLLKSSYYFAFYIYNALKKRS